MCSLCLLIFSTILAKEAMSANGCAIEVEVGGLSVLNRRGLGLGLQLTLFRAGSCQVPPGPLVHTSRVLIHQVQAVDRRPHQFGYGDPAYRLKDENHKVPKKMW